MPLKYFKSQTSPNWFMISNMVLDQMQTQTQSPSSIFAYSVCSGFHLLSILLTCSALLLATITFSFLKTCSLAPHPNPDSEQKQRQQLEEEEEEAIEDHDGACDSLLSSSAENTDNTSSGEEAAEGEWAFGEDLDPTREPSDGSISDEESLIEIALPNGYYMEPEKQRSLWSDCCSMEQSLMMELLAEINEMAEEENMIEIDISMGSIMCPRFEIKA